MSDKPLAIRTGYALSLLLLAAGLSGFAMQLGATEWQGGVLLGMLSQPILFVCFPEARFWEHRDSGRLPKAGDDPSSAPCEASQSGGSEASASPNSPNPYSRPTGE